MSSHTPVWKWALGLVALTVGAAISVPLYRYADQDDAPGGMVIAVLIFVIGAVAAAWIVGPRRESSESGSN